VHLAKASEQTDGCVSSQIVRGIPLVLGEVLDRFEDLKEAVMDHVDCLLHLTFGRFHVEAFLVCESDEELAQGID